MKKLPILVAAIAVFLITALASGSSLDDLKTQPGELTFSSSETEEKSIELNADWRSASAVTLSISLDHRLALPVRATFFLVNSEGLYYRTARRIVVNDRPQTVVLDLSDDSPDWYPVGHARPWTSFNLWRVSRFGVSLSAPKPISASVSIGDVKLVQSSSSDPKAAVARKPVVIPYSLRIERLGESLVALDFVASETPETPFFANDAPVLKLTTPDGVEITRRAFLFQDYAALREPVGSVADLIPVGPVRWRVVWREKTQGKYHYALTLSTNSAEMTGDFTTADAPAAQLPQVKSIPEFDLAFYQVSVPRVSARYSKEEHQWKVLSQDASVQNNIHSAWFIPLEWYGGWCSWNGPNYYDLRIAYLADLVLLQAGSGGLPVVAISDSELDDHGTFRWGTSPLNARNGGPLVAPQGLFLNAAALNQVAMRAAYITDRWGDFPSVSGIVTAVTALSGLAPSWHKRVAETLAPLGVTDRLPLLSSNRMALSPKGELLLSSFEGPGDLLRPEKSSDTLNTVFTPSKLSSTLGHTALSLTHNQAGAAPFETRLMGGLSLGDHSLLAIDVKLPEEAQSVARLQFILRDGQYGWYEYLSPDLLSPGDWNTVIAPLNDMSVWKKLGRCADYNPYTRQDIKELRIRVFPNQEMKGPVLLDNLRCMILADESPPRLEIVDVRPNGDKVPVWGRYELSFDTTRAFANPFDPDIVDISGDFVLPDGRTFVMPGFFYQEYTRTETKSGEELLAAQGRPYWKIRFAPPIPGKYSARITVRSDKGKEAVSYGPLTFTAVPDTSAGKGPVKALGPNALGFADGSTMYPIGMNLRSPSDMRDGQRDPEVLKKVSLADERKTFQYDDYFAAFQKNGLNWARVWMCSWWLGLEWYRKWPGFRGPGSYNLANAWRLDHIMEEAAKRGVYVQLELQNHGQVSTNIDHEWEYNPYNYYDPEAYTPQSRVTDHELELRPDAENFRNPSGFLRQAQDFFTDERAKRLTRNRLRYVIARWSYSDHIFAWILSSEVEFTGEYWLSPQGYDKGERSPKTAAWHREMASFIKKIDPYKHLVSTHFSHPQRGPDVWAVTELDFIQSNAYSTFWWFGGQGMDREVAQNRGKPEPSVGAPAAVQKYYDDFLRGWNRPVTVGEWGGHWMSNPRPFLDAELHTGTWAMAVSPLSGATGFWWWPHVHFRDKYALMSAIIPFIKDRNRPAEGINRMHGSLVRARDLQVLAYGRPDWGADCYIYHRQLPYDIASPVSVEAGASLKLTGLKPGFYAVKFWDTWKGSVINQVESTALNGVIDIDLPAFRGDIAISVRRKGDSPAPANTPSSQPPSTTPSGQPPAATREPGR